MRGIACTDSLSSELLDRERHQGAPCGSWPEMYAAVLPLSGPLVTHLCAFCLPAAVAGSHSCGWQHDDVQVQGNRGPDSLAQPHTLK